MLFFVRIYAEGTPVLSWIIADGCVPRSVEEKIRMLMSFSFVGKDPENLIYSQQR